MRQIELMTRSIAQFIFHKDTSPEFQIVEQYFQTDELSAQINEFIFENNFCAAENLLFEYMDRFRGIDFSAQARILYSRLNEFSDEELEAANFSRKEINDGILAVVDFYKPLL